MKMMHNTTTSETIGGGSSFKSSELLKKSKMINLIKIKSSNSSKINSSNDLMSNKSSSSLEKLDDKFCGAFQEHYEYLMDKGLIETCQRSTNRGDQTLTTMNTITNNQAASSTNSLSNNTTSSNVSYREFLHQYNELKRWLERLQSFSNETDSLSSYCEKYTNQIFYEEILKRSPRRELLNEYAGHLVKYHPHLKKEVLVKLQFLNRQWKFMEYSIVSKHYFNQNITKDLEQDLKNFELWLCKVEYIIESLHVEADWSLGEMEKRLNQHNCLQYDIESHAKIINSVLKLINKLKQLYIDCNKFHEIGLSLQNRWHCLWIKSLEWQCRLEQEIARKKKIAQNLDTQQASLLSPSYSSATANHLDDDDDDEESTHTFKTNRVLECGSNNRRPSRATAAVGGSSSFTTNNTYTPSDSQASSLDEDIIPFDKCEYEKIVITTSSTSTILNRYMSGRRYSTTRNHHHLLVEDQREEKHLLSKSCFNLRSVDYTTRRSNRAMSVENMMNNETELFMNNENNINNSSAATKASLTESELDCNKMAKSSQKRRNNKTSSSRLHRRKDLSYYYSLTNVKYYNIDNDDESTTFNDLESSSRGLVVGGGGTLHSNSSLNSSTTTDDQHSWSTNKSSDDQEKLSSLGGGGRLQKSFTMPSQLSSHDTVDELVKKQQDKHDKSWSSSSLSSSEEGIAGGGACATLSSSLTSLSSSLSGSYNLTRPLQSLYIQPNYKSYSDYCVTTGLFSPMRRQRRQHHNVKQPRHHHHHAYHSRYSSNYLLSKSLSMQRVVSSSVPHHYHHHHHPIDDDDQNGNEADYDDNDKDDEDEETDEYNYDNEYYAQYHDNEDEHDQEIIDDDKMRRNMVTINCENFGEKKSSTSGNNKQLLLNNTIQSSSAYDTCSNLSSNNENSSSLSCSNSCKNSDRLSSGNASGGDYSLNDEYLKMSGASSTRSGASSQNGGHGNGATSSSDNHDDSINDDSSHMTSDDVMVKTFDVTTAATASEEDAMMTRGVVESSHQHSEAHQNTTVAAVAALIDESSTVNTDVSDPHWDGYNNSPYYNNNQNRHTTIEEDALFSREKLTTQPILPWDELFFELDPIEEIPRNNNEPCLNRKRTRSVSKRIPPPNELQQSPSVDVNGINGPAAHQHHYYLHHHHHYYQLNSNLKSQGLKSKSKSRVVNKQPVFTSTSAAAAVLNSTNNYSKSTQIQLLKSHSYDDSSCNATVSSEEAAAAAVVAPPTSTSLAMTVNRSVEEYERTWRRLVNHHDDDDDESTNLSMLISVLGTTPAVVVDSTTPTTSIGAFLHNINLPKYNEILEVCDRNLTILSSIRVDKETTGKKSTSVERLAFVLEELTNKWRMLEQMAAGERQVNERLGKLASDLNLIREHIVSLAGECKFDHKLFEIDFKQIVPLLLKQFQENILALIDMENKLDEQKSHYFEVIDRLNMSSINNKASQSVTLKLVDKMGNEVHTVEELHRTTTHDIKYKLKKLESLANLWSSIEASVDSIESILSKPQLSDDVRQLLSYIENMDTWLSLFKSDLQDLAQTESLTHRLQASTSKRSGGSGKHLIAFYEQHVQKLESYRDLMIKRVMSTTPTNHISLDLNEPLITMNSDVDFYKTSTPRIQPQLLVLPQELEGCDSGGGGGGELREEFKHVARVNNTAIEIKILSKKKPRVVTRKSTTSKAVVAERRRRVKTVKEEEEEVDNQAVDAATTTTTATITSSSQTENDSKVVVVATTAYENSHRLSRAVTFAKNLFYALLFIVLLLLVLIVSIPFILYQQGGSSEYRQFLLFNQRTLNDQPLPF